MARPTQIKLMKPTAAILPMLLSLLACSGSGEAGNGSTDAGASGNGQGQGTGGMGKGGGTQTATGGAAQAAGGVSGGQPSSTTGGQAVTGGAAATAGQSGSAGNTATAGSTAVGGKSASAGTTGGGSGGSSGSTATGGKAGIAGNSSIGGSTPTGGQSGAGTTATGGSSGSTAAGGGGAVNLPSKVCDEPEALVDTTAADHVVGDGTPASCTEQKLREAVEAGGIITFACGDAPFTFRLTDTLRPARQTCNWANNGPCSRANAVIDGGGKITLDGQGAVRPITFNTEDHNDTTLTLRLQRLRFVGGNSVSYGSGASCETDTRAGGGAVYLFGGNLVVIECEFSDNHGPPNGSDVAGGAVYSRGLGKTTVIRSVFEGNSCATGGAIGVLASSLEVVNSRIIDNQASGADCGGNGGGVYQDGRGSDTVGKGSTLAICGTTISGNTCTQFGGAFFRTAYGTDQTSRIDRSTFDGNTSTRFGGALYLQGTPVTLTNSTLSNNQAHGNALYVMDHNASGYTAPGQLDMTNVTIAGNHNLDWGACAVVVEGTSSGTWQNVTVTGNVGDRVTQAISSADTATVTISNSILQECNRAVSGGNNLQWPEGGTACTSDVTLADPELGGLAANGGPTLTMAPAGTSPAVAVGSACASTDQRGVARAPACTLGAYEVE